MLGKRSEQLLLEHFICVKSLLKRPLENCHPSSMEFSECLCQDNSQVLCLGPTEITEGVVGELSLNSLDDEGPICPLNWLSRETTTFRTGGKEKKNRSPSSVTTCSSGKEIKEKRVGTPQLWGIVVTAS